VIARAGWLGTVDRAKVPDLGEQTMTAELSALSKDVLRPRGTLLSLKPTRPDQ